MTTIQPIVTTVSVSVVIVSYNCRQLVLDSLASLFATAPRASYEVIVVDNASADGTVEAVRATYPAVHVIGLENNIGFGRGCNVGAADAQGDFILLLNPDTLVRPHAIDKLVELANARPDAGIWGGRTVTMEGAVIPGSCWRFPTVWSTFCIVTGLSLVFSGSRLFNREIYGGETMVGVREVEVVSGCLLMIGKPLWDKLGGFDPAYFMYSEETDLCLRAYRMGVRPVVSADVQIVHLVGATQPVRADRLVRLLKGRRTYMRRHWSLLGSGVGAALLLGWPLSRFWALSVAALLSRRARWREAAHTWGNVWRRRAEWLPGWQGTPAT